MKCRYCGEVVDQVFVDLGHQPPSNAYLTREQLAQPEVTFPLRVFVCNHCWLVQLPEHAGSGELFNETYAYFSSVSSTWVDHAKSYVEKVVARFGLDATSFVVEVASNDGYLLQFVQKRGIRCLGVEPTASTAAVSMEKGIETVEEFFGKRFASSMVEEFGTADLLIGNNVLAHVPDLNDFVEGVVCALSTDGVATFEFPHLMRLVEGRQFDTIYHEHYSYLSLSTVNRIFESHGLKIFDVEEIETHGGSLRVYACRASSRKHDVTRRVAALRGKEESEGLLTAEYYSEFQAVVDGIKNRLLAHLLDLKSAEKKIYGYGAAAKGNTLLNYAGVTPDLLPLVADAAPSKQGKFLPGSHIPICTPERLIDEGPDQVLILPWNIVGEIVAQLSERSLHRPFIVAIPELRQVA